MEEFNLPESYEKFLKLNYPNWLGANPAKTVNVKKEAIAKYRQAIPLLLSSRIQAMNANAQESNTKSTAPLLIKAVTDAFDKYSKEMTDKIFDAYYHKELLNKLIQPDGKKLFEDVTILMGPNLVSLDILTTRIIDIKWAMLLKKYPQYSAFTDSKYDLLPIIQGLLKNGESALLSAIQQNLKAGLIASANEASNSMARASILAKEQQARDAANRAANEAGKMPTNANTPPFNYEEYQGKGGPIVPNTPSVPNTTTEPEYFEDFISEPIADKKSGIMPLILGAITLLGIMS